MGTNPSINESTGVRLDMKTVVRLVGFGLTVLAAVAGGAWTAQGWVSNVSNHMERIDDHLEFQDKHMEELQQHMLQQDQKLEWLMNHNKDVKDAPTGLKEHSFVVAPLMTQVAPQNAANTPDYRQ